MMIHIIVNGVQFILSNRSLHRIVIYHILFFIKYQRHLRRGIHQGNAPLRIGWLFTPSAQIDKAVKYIYYVRSLASPSF
jgi:hypothetical protein